MLGLTDEARQDFVLVVLQQEWRGRPRMFLGERNTCLIVHRQAFDAADLIQRNASLLHGGLDTADDHTSVVAAVALSKQGCHATHMGLVAGQGCVDQIGDTPAEIGRKVSGG
ncbi:hypothetical protein D3C86_1384850 [compost metagenome]